MFSFLYYIVSSLLKGNVNNKTRNCSWTSGTEQSWGLLNTAGFFNICMILPLKAK